MADTETVEQELFTLEQAYEVVLGNATAEGRCPHCGRRHEDDHETTFAALREELATARTERDEANKELESAQESNERYAAEVASLEKLLVEATEE